MKFKMGDKVYITLFGTQRKGVIVWVYPERKTYQVSVDNGGGGFHVVTESEIILREE